MAQTAQVLVDINGDGQAETIALQPSGERRFVLALNGSETEATVENISLDSERQPGVRIIELGNNHRAAIYHVPLQGQNIAFEAVLFPRQNTPVPQVIWSGIVGLRGDLGTRWGNRVIVDDLTGDGHPNILVAAIAEEVPLCGVTEPELFPQALDPSAGRLRPVILNRLRQLEIASTPLEATLEGPETIEQTPIISVASFAIPSTMAGDRGAVESLGLAGALTDNDLNTAWIEGRPGPGTNEFVTARLLPGPYQLRALALTLSLTPGSDQRPRLGRLRTFHLIANGQSGLQRFTVTVPEDPEGHQGEPFWVIFPEPLQANCLSIVLGDVFADANARSSTAIVEVDVFTDLDFEGGTERLAEALRQGSADVEVILRALGSRALPLIHEHWSELDSAARRRAIRVMTQLNDPNTAELLADAALSSESQEEAEQALVALSDQALPFLVPGLTHADENRRGRAAQIIGNIGTIEAARHLVERMTSSAPEEDLRALREALSQALTNCGTEGRNAVLESASEAEGRVRYALLAALSPVEQPEQERFADLVTESWTKAKTFENRYRVLSLTNAAPDSKLQGLASKVLLGDEDRYLRARAAEVIAKMKATPGLVKTLAEATADGWVGVRLAATEALGSSDSTEAQTALSTVLANDPWPIVRAEAATSLVRSSSKVAAPRLISALGDSSAMVQTTAARLLGRMKLPESFEPLKTLAQNREAPVKSRQAAARALGGLCTQEVETILLDLLRRGVRGRPTPNRAKVAAAAAEALSSYPSDEVQEMLARAAHEAAPGLRLAAIEALGQSGHQNAEKAQKTLESFSEDPMAPLRAAAAEALRNLEMGDFSANICSF